MSIMCETCNCTRPCGECKEKECSVSSLPLEITSEISSSSNYVCDFCREKRRVIKLRIPERSFFATRITGYTYLWLCESCRDALRKVIDLEFPKEEESL